MSSFYLSPNVEKVGKGLDILVKEKKQAIGYLSSLFSGGRSASQEPSEYKVGIEHKCGPYQLLEYQTCKDWGRLRLIN